MRCYGVYFSFPYNSITTSSEMYLWCPPCHWTRGGHLWLGGGRAVGPFPPNPPEWLSPALRGLSAKEEMQVCYGQGHTVFKGKKKKIWNNNYWWFHITHPRPNFIPSFLMSSLNWTSVRMKRCVMCISWMVVTNSVNILLCEKGTKKKVVAYKWNE